MIESGNYEKRCEMRHSERHPIRVQGKDIRGNFFVEVVLTENISNSGACFSLNREVVAGQRLNIFVSKGRLQKQLPVSIRWVNNFNGIWRVGIRFDRPTKEW